jgi:hypothetical protein
MALGLSTESSGSGGDILPIVKWDAKGGDFLRQDRYQAGDGTWQKDEQEIAFPCQVAMDLANIEVGWLSFASGAPDFQMVKIGESIPARPSEDHKNAFRVRLTNKELGLREFSHSAKTVLRQMDELHSQYEREAPNHPDKVPVVTFEGAETVKINGPQGELRFKPPIMKITGWVDRPQSLSGNAAPAPQTTPAAVSAPPAPIPPAEAAAGADLF